MNAYLSPDYAAIQAACGRQYRHRQTAIIKVPANLTDPGYTITTDDLFFQTWDHSMRRLDLELSVERVSRFLTGNWS